MSDRLGNRLRSDLLIFSRRLLDWCRRSHRSWLGDLPEACLRGSLFDFLDDRCGLVNDRVHVSVLKFSEHTAGVLVDLHGLLNGLNIGLSTVRNVSTAERDFRNIPPGQLSPEKDYISGTKWAG